MEDYCPQTAMEKAAGIGHVMESQVLLSPAILWGILISERDLSQRNEANAADDGWLYTAGKEAETDEDVRDAESARYTEGLFAESGTRPDILWGLRQSGMSSQVTSNDECPSGTQALDSEATTKLWIAAGYNFEPTEGSGAVSAVRDARLIYDDDGEPTKSYHPPPGPYNIKKAHGKGQGVYTSQDIPRGTRILVDKPFFAVSKPYTLHTIIEKFDQMCLASRRLYMQFSCPDRPDDEQMSDVTRIFEANCFNIDYSAAIFQTATRFNHSCLPNTHYSWSEARQELVFQAMIDVEKEEELTIAYGRPFLSHQERRRELRNYNFKCNCPACQLHTPFGQASESRRLVMKTLDEQIVICQTAHSEGLLTNGVQDPLSLIVKLIELIEEEGLKGELMGPYRRATELLRGRGDWKEALVFANKQLEEERTCLGEDSEVVGKTRECIEELEIMAAKRGLPEEDEELELKEIQDSSDLGAEFAGFDNDTRRLESHLRTKPSQLPLAAKDSHSQTPAPESSNSPLATYALRDRPYPEPLLEPPPLSPSPPSPSPSPSQLHPPLHLTLAIKDAQNIIPLKYKQVEAEPASDHDSSAEAHEPDAFFRAQG